MLIEVVSDLQGEGRHTRTKGFNSRTNFNNATPQIIGMDVREAVHDQMTHELETLNKSAKSQSVAPENAVTDPTEWDKSYHMARDEKNKVFLPDLLEKNESDPAYRVRISSSLPLNFQLNQCRIFFPVSRAIFC